MPKVLRFEELEVWQAAKVVVLDAYRLGRTGALARDYGFKDQLQRAAVSVMSNIAEGFERGGNREFIQFLYIAKGSAAEVRSLVHIGTELGYIGEADRVRVIEELSSIGRQLGGFIKYLEATAPLPRRANSRGGCAPVQGSRRKIEDPDRTDRAS
jgi:four helix bundle protein